MEPFDDETDRIHAKRGDAPANIQPCREGRRVDIRICDLPPQTLPPDNSKVRRFSNKRAAA